MTLGQKIAEARKEKGLSGAALSRLSGISGAFLSDIENGKRTPSVEVTRKIEQALELDLSKYDIRVLWDRLRERAEEHPRLLGLYQKIATGEVGVLLGVHSPPRPLGTLEPADLRFAGFELLIRPLTLDSTRSVGSILVSDYAAELAAEPQEGGTEAEPPMPLPKVTLDPGDVLEIAYGLGSITLAPDVQEDEPAVEVIFVAEEE